MPRAEDELAATFWAKGSNFREDRAAAPGLVYRARRLFGRGEASVLMSLMVANTGGANGNAQSLPCRARGRHPKRMLEVELVLRRCSAADRLSHVRSLKGFEKAVRADLAIR
jgi:hypothetical protein